MLGMNVVGRINMEIQDIDERIIKACLLSALDVMRLTLVNIDVNYNSDDTADIDIVVEKKKEV